MSPEPDMIDPVLSKDERNELSHLEYLSARVKELLDRGLITSESLAAIEADGRQRREAIERHGRYMAAMSQARSLVQRKQREALNWAQRAREIDPARPEPCEMAVDLLWTMERDEEAIALCAEVAGIFPHLGRKHDALVTQLASRAESRREKAEQARRGREVSDRLAEAKMAVGDRRDEEAIALCREVLAASPDRLEALQMAAYASQRLGRIDEALELYKSLASLQPTNSVWPEWARNLQIRRRFEGTTGKDGEASTDGHGAADREGLLGAFDAPPPRWSWSSFAAEFLEEHWQKLILCLAVLLIVVSSTVGAHLLLGPMLWQPAGKCALALIWTILFAALGVGLIRWGAERAGQMMLVATLIVVPIHFMLAGELKLVTEPSVTGAIVAAVDGLALVGLVRVVAGMLVPRGEARFLSVALLLLSVGSVVTARGSPVGWGWQFAAFQVPALVFLGSVWCLGLRRWGGTDEAHRPFAILVLGLLGFAFLACTIRIGAYALRLEPALYAVPVMLGALATVAASRRLAPYESDARLISGIRFGGYVLSGLAFALALTPPAATALFSTNTVAASLLGFALYAGALRRDRHPAFLYLSIAALVAARVGAHYFLAERIRLVIDALRRLLGYPDSLPIAYLSLIALVIGPALAGLAVWFRRGWKDERLARHCRYIGLPVAVVACLWSCQEPEAAFIVLSGYAVLFGLAVWLYAMPLLSYATILAACGAAYFGSTLVAGVTLADQALLAIALAWIGLGIGRMLLRLGAAEEFATPWVHASRALLLLSVVVASDYIARRGAHSPAAAVVFSLSGLLGLITARERPQMLNAGLVLLCFIEFTICGLSLVTGGRPHPPGTYGLLLACDGLALLAVAQVLERIGRVHRPEPAGATADEPLPSPVVEVFRLAIARFVIGLTIIADFVAFLDQGGNGIPGLVWLLGAPALLGTTRRVQEVSLVYLGIAQFVAGVLALSHWAMPFAQPGLTVGWLGLIAAALALVLWLAGTVARRGGLSNFYASPCLNASLGLTAAVLAMAVGSRLMIRDAYRFGVAALVLNVLVTVLLAGTWRRFELTYGAILHVVVATYIVLFSVGQNDPRMAYVLGLAAVIEALIFWVVGFACERVGSGGFRPYARPLYHMTVVMTFLGILLADRSGATMGLAALAFLLTIKSVPSAGWLYLVAACLGAACYFRWLSGLAPVGLMAFAVLGAFALWAIGVLVQRSREALCERLGLRPLAYEGALFQSSLVTAMIAVTLRVSLSVNSGLAATAYAWFPLVLALLSLLMLRAYPAFLWMHLSLGFLVYGVVSSASPSLNSFAAIGLAGAALALGLSLLDRVVRDHEPAICYRLGVRGGGYLVVVQMWSLLLFVLAIALTISIVLRGLLGSLVLVDSNVVAGRVPEWWMILGSLIVAAGYLALMGADPERWGSVQPAVILIGLHAFGVLALWWLGVTGSPFSRWLPPVADYYPIATALTALLAILLGRRFAHPETWHELGWVRDVRSEGAQRALAFQAWGLALVAILFTGGAVSGTTVGTWALGAVVMGVAGLMSGWAPSAATAGLAWTGAGSVLGVWIARQLGLMADDEQTTLAAWGAIASAFSLWRLAGMKRAGGWSAKGRAWSDAAASDGLRDRFAPVVEGVASAAGLFASALVLGRGLQAVAPAAWVTFGGVGVLLAAALLHIVLAPRWRAEWPVYLAQVLMVGAYVVFRLAFPLSNAADAAVLTLLAYLDMAISEALDHLDRDGYYTRPTRYASLVLPLLPLLQLLTAPRLDEVSLFYLAAAATFYATACGRLRWKTLGYAAAVFANAALWVLWSRVGWRLSEYPQLYLVPVGLSAILFAEVNRELGRPTVNAIRSVGLIVIYVSLAMPIWRFESFGAWLTLLLASLLGVFIGIGLRLQTFLWLGLTTFVLDVVYEMGRVSLDYAMAKWAIMLALGLSLVLFVALNEKKRILSQMLDYYAHVRTWE
jgi:tetratricopeptide (TPR) repeat protein